MKKIFAFFILVIFFLIPAYSQEWEKRYSFVEKVIDIAQVKDTVILLAEYQIDLNRRFALVTIDSLGDTIRVKKYPISLMFSPQSMVATNDSMLMLAGYFTVNTGYSGDAYITMYKLNLLGDTIWTKRYPKRIDQSLPIKVINSIDTGYLLLGTENSPGIQNPLLMKIDLNGSVIWSKTDSTINNASFVLEDENGDLFLTGHSDYPNDSIYLCKLNSQGNLLWKKEYPASSFYTKLLTIAKHADGYLICGGEDNFVYKVDSEGNLLWLKTFEYHVNSAIEIPDNNILFASRLGSPGDSINVFGFHMLTTNSTGDNLSSKFTYGQVVLPNFPHAIKPFKANDSTYFVVGELQGGYVAKLIIKPNQEILENNEVLAFPNPFIDEIQFVVTGAEDQISFFLYDSHGNVTKTIIPQSNEFIVNREGLIEGFYYYHILSGNNIFSSGRLLIVK